MSDHVPLLEPAFARHETFHPRVGWLSKAVAAVAADGHVFADERAPITLGVGKNMTRAIRYWGLATKVIEEVPGEGGRSPGLRPTPLGHTLLGPEGWDRYVEDPRTSWILHWMLLRPPVIAPVWWWMFFEFDCAEFAPVELERFALRRVEEWGWERPAASSIQKDVDCAIRMYGRRSRKIEDDSLDSPFAALRLIEPSPADNHRWRFVSGAKEDLEPEVIAYAAIEAMEGWDPTAKTTTVARLATGRGGPGRAFRISERDIADALRSVASHEPLLEVASPAGLSQLVIRDHPARLRRHLLASLYGRDISEVDPLELAGKEATVGSP